VQLDRNSELVKELQLTMDLKDNFERDYCRIKDDFENFKAEHHAF